MLTTMLLSLVLTLAPPHQSNRFTVYTSAPMRDGFADTSKDIQDSIKDVGKRLDGMKEMQSIDSKERADIILTIVTRGVGSQTFGERTSYTQYYRGADLTTTPILANTWWVSSM